MFLSISCGRGGCEAVGGRGEVGKSGCAPTSNCPTSDSPSATLHASIALLLWFFSLSESKGVFWPRSSQPVFAWLRSIFSTSCAWLRSIFSFIFFSSASKAARRKVVFNASIFTSIFTSLSDVCAVCMSLTQDVKTELATPDIEANKKFSVTGSISARLGNENVLADKPPGNDIRLPQNKKMTAQTRVFVACRASCSTEGVGRAHKKPKGSCSKGLPGEFLPWLLASGIYHEPMAASKFSVVHDRK